MWHVGFWTVNPQPKEFQMDSTVENTLIRKRRVSNFSDLMLFINNLPEPYRSKGMTLVNCCDDDNIEEVREKYVEFVSVSNKAKRYHDEVNGLLGIFTTVIKTARNHGFDVMEPHFQILQRFLEEQRAPFPSEQEILASALPSVQKMTKLCRENSLNP
jgi:hypothetical protein